MNYFIICAGILGLFGLLFAFLLAWRYLNYRETLALAEKGLLRPISASAGDQHLLRAGIILTAIGLALCIGLQPLGVGRYLFGISPWMLIGLLPLFLGLALMAIHVLDRRQSRSGGDDRFKPEDIRGPHN